MTEFNKEVSNRTSFDIDKATKLIAFVSISLYFVGFMTTNLYLRKFDFSDFSLIKPRFILTGGLVVFTIILSRLFFEFRFFHVSNKFSDFFTKDKFTIRQLPFLLFKATKIFFSPIL